MRLLSCGRDAPDCCQSCVNVLLFFGSKVQVPVCDGEQAAGAFLLAVQGTGKANKFQIGYECICGKYYLVQILYQKGLCWFYDIYDITTGKRVSHYRYGLAEYESGVDEGFILRFDGQEYRIVPDYVEDNVLYWSRFNEDNTTTLFAIHL